MTPQTETIGWRSGLAGAALTLGVALGGFFDGILLHQVLQWHHLLSLVPGEDVQKLQTQILADGLFHVLMYALALAGLLWLWRSRARFGAPGAGRLTVGAALLGFGLWNVVDVALFHWILGIHRIRVDVPTGDRLRWDLLWLLLFALPPLLAAWVLTRAKGRGGRDGPVALGALVLLAGALSLRAPPEATARAVLFGPGVSHAEVFAAIAAEGGEVLWVGGDGRLVGVDLPEGAGGWGLYARGALLVGGPGSPSACLSWLRAA